MGHEYVIPWGPYAREFRDREMTTVDMMAPCGASGPIISVIFIIQPIVIPCPMILPACDPKMLYSRIYYVVEYRPENVG